MAYTTQNSLLLNNLLEFYKESETLDKMLNIINGESKISLRIVDWFSTNFAKKNYTVYNLDEFRTSCLNYKTEEKCENIYLPDKKGKERKIHSILTYQTESKRMGCINRDKNAVNNMVKIINYYLKNKSRPEKFRRDYKFPN